MIVRRQAALVLVGAAAGIRALAGLLVSKSTFERRSAAFAFNDLTERLDGRHPEIVATPEILAATKEALSTLVQALNDKDEIVRCMAFESLPHGCGRN